MVNTPVLFDRAQWQRKFKKIIISLPNWNAFTGFSLASPLSLFLSLKTFCHRFDRVESVLDALLHYIDCLKLEIGSSYRLCHLINNLIVNEKSAIVTDSLTQLTKKLCSPEITLEETSTCKTKIYESLTSTKDIEHLFETYHSRKRDFNTGLLNFKILLENMNLGERQLDRLQRQFDNVFLNYQHSRCLLDQELPYATSQRMRVMVECFEHLSGDLRKVVSNRRDLAGLLGGLHEALKGGAEAQAIKGCDSSASCNSKSSHCNCYDDEQMPPR